MCSVMFVAPIFENSSVSIGVVVTMGEGSERSSVGGDEIEDEDEEASRLASLVEVDDERGDEDGLVVVVDAKRLLGDVGWLIDILADLKLGNCDP